MDDDAKDDPMTDEPQPDEQDLTPPHGDDLRSEDTFGRTDRYTNVDDDEAQHAIIETPPSADSKVETAERHKRFDQIDDAEADAARMDVRRHEHSAGRGPRE
jgi:hypothetical protein